MDNLEAFIRARFFCFTKFHSLMILTKSCVKFMVLMLLILSVALQPCYAKKVEVEDYMFLCLARVELNDQNLTLLGILGSWWVLPLSSWQEAFSMLRNSFLIR